MTVGDKDSRAKRNLRGHLVATTFAVIHRQEDNTDEGSGRSGYGVTRIPRTHRHKGQERTALALRALPWSEGVPLLQFNTL